MELKTITGAGILSQRRSQRCEDAKKTNTETGTFHDRGANIFYSTYRRSRRLNARLWSPKASALGLQRSAASWLPQTPAPGVQRCCLFSATWDLRQNATNTSRIMDLSPFLLDNFLPGGTIEISPPIHFRIEWVRDQRIVTALWLRAHFIAHRILPGACLYNEGRLSPQPLI